MVQKRKNLKGGRHIYSYDVFLDDKNHPYIEGRGIFQDVKEGVKNLYNKGVEKIKKVPGQLMDAYTSETGTNIRNAIDEAQGDPTYRPGFPGEKHQMLFLPNGKKGIANYSGPGTHVIERLERGDPPRTKADATARLHDIQYAMAQYELSPGRQKAKLREADLRMIKNLNDIEKAGTDDIRNVALARTLIHAKTALEDSGHLTHNFGGPLKKRDPTAIKILEKNKRMMEMEGYGRKRKNKK